jgi:hypothetical protein
VERRDSIWKKHHLKTDEAETQWKRIMNECKVRVTYALSPQAKGKIERPYRWLQDRVVRICAREQIATASGVRDVLNDEVIRYNNHQVHSTTGEIPEIRFERAIGEGKHLFRPFKVPYPLESTKDIFCIKEGRITNAYRRISLDGIELKVPGVDPHQKVELRMVPDKTTNLTEIRFWHNGKLTGTQKIKTADLKSLNY